MTKESVNANSRMCVTLRLDPCPLSQINISFGAIFEIFQQDTEKRGFNKIEFFFSLNNCIYEDISTRPIKELGLGAL